jgi:predicted HAD superfamily Cof-like phosphohydrolase
MNKTNFEQVVEFNKLFGVPVFDKLNKKIFENNEKLANLRLSLIKEEVSELQDAFEKRDFKEIIDSLTDILYVVYGMGASFGIDLDKSHDIVHKSNMSKLCKTEEEAIETVEWYSRQQTRYDSPTYKKSSDFWIVFNESTGKILKSVNYIPADFAELFEE